MSIGDKYERTKIKIKNAITELSNSFNGYEVREVNSNDIRYSFYKKYGTEEWTFYIMNEDIEADEWACGWYRTHALSIRKDLEEPEHYFSTLEKCVAKLKDELLWRKSNSKFNETQHFERGLDPKDAMSVGDVQGRKIEKAKQEINDAIKQLAKENKVDPNAVEWPYDGIGFTMPGGFGFKMHGSFSYFIDYDHR
jgi:hypothetical protein